MTGTNPPLGKHGARILAFRRYRGTHRQTAVSPVQDLVKFERGPREQAEEPGEYRHRMIVNLAAFLVVIALICTGLWLADTMARMRKDQDCVLSGRRGCTPVEVIPKDRW